MKRDNQKKWSNLLIALFILLLIVSLIVGIKLAYPFIFGKIAHQQEDIAYQQEDISVLLTIFSIIVTFWLGINIYNSLDKNEIHKLVDHNKQTIAQQLGQKFDSFESKMNDEIRKINETSEKTNDLLKDVEEEAIGLTNTLQKVLFRSSLDRQNTWYELFYKLSEEVEKEIDYNALCIIIQIEQLYNKVYRIYYTGEYFHYLEEYSTQGIQLIKKANKLLLGLEKSQWRDVYLVIRESDFLFFGQSILKIKLI